MKRRDRQPQQAPRRGRVVAAVVVTLAVGFAAGAAWAIPVIQRDLVGKAADRIAAVGVSGVSVSFSGQDATVTCTSPLKDLVAVKAAVLDIKGVRSVGFSSECSTTTSTPTDNSTAGTGTGANSVPGSAITVTPVVKLAADGKVTISGRVDTAAQSDALVAAAITSFGSTNVTVTLTTNAQDGNQSDAIVDQFVSLITVFAGRLKSGTAGIVEGKLYIKGIANDSTSLSALTIAAKNAGATKADIALTLDAAEVISATNITVMFADNKMTITGTVGTREQKLALFHAADDVLSASDVADSVTLVDKPTSEADADQMVVEDLGVLIRAMPANLLSGEVGYDVVGLRATGVYLNEASKAAFEAVAKGVGVTPTLTARPDGGESEAASMQQQLNDYVAANPFLFTSNTPNLLSGSETLLDRVAEIAKEFKGTFIEVQGHTDNEGDAIRNLNLSQARADVIVYELVKRGIPPEQLFARGYGETRPKVSNDTAAHRAINRRVEFVVTAG
ncbi:MAG: OmpA family protein [Actinobacteria bacterium]|nr:OmpA family protein [Actinomycetota bacterium]